MAAVPLNPDTPRTQLASPALILCAEMALVPPEGRLATAPGQTGPGWRTISDAHGSAQGARGREG